MGRLELSANIAPCPVTSVRYLPVFLDDSQGKPAFWGFTLVLIRYPQAFEEARLPQLTEQGIGYELWRIHPDSGQKQSIVASTAAALIDPVTRTLSMLNGSWSLSLAPIKGWDEPLWLIFKSALGLLFSLLLGYLVKLLFELRAHKRQLETLVQHRTAEISTTQTKLQATFDAIPDLIWLKDAQGVYLDCNPMFERLLGAKKAAILGKTAYDFLEPEQAASFREYDRQAIASGQSTVNEEWLTFAGDGRRRLFETTRTPMRDGDGQLVGVMGIAHDITESRRAQDEILSAMVAVAVADQANVAKSAFLANMSHEIRTPMNSIIGMAHLALKTELSPKQRDYIAKIQQASQHLLGIINDILDLSKIETHKLVLETLDFDLPTVVRELSNQIRDSATAKGLALVFDMAPQLSQPLRGDPLRLRQILLNYIGNAIKFTDQGQIIVRANLLEEEADNLLVRFEVQDTGIGMSQAVVAQIFQTFHQADNSTTRRRSRVLSNATK